MQPTEYCGWMGKPLAWYLEYSGFELLLGALFPKGFPGFP
jgi:hypothetical protein